MPFFILLHPAVEFLFQQSTRTLLHQGVGNRIGAGITGSPLQANGGTRSLLRPRLLSRHLHSSAQARAHTTNPRLNAASNHGVSGQNSQPNDDGAKPPGRDSFPDLDENALLRLLDAGFANLNRQLGKNYHSIFAFSQDLRRDPMTPYNGELALLGTARGDSWGEQRSAMQADPSQGREALLTDDTQRAATIYAYFNTLPWGGGVHLVSMARYLSFAAFPENQRFNLPMGSQSHLRGYARSHSDLLQNLFRGLQDNSIQRPEHVLNLSANSIAPGEGSWGNGGCMGIAPIVSVVDLRPYIEDESLVQLTQDTVRVTHNHPHSIAAATAIALAARSSIDYREALEEGQGASRQAFAEATIARIRRHVQDDRFLYYLGIVEQNLDGSNSHGSVMSQLNSNPSGRAVAGDEGIFFDMRAPNTAAAVLHFFFSETRSQQALLDLVDQYTADKDTVGAILMALSALREGGFWRNEFSADEVSSLLEQFPEWVRMRRDPNIFLIDPPADKGAPPEPEKKQD